VETTRLLLIRHGESNATVQRVIGGPRTCSGLSPLGRKQAEALADRLARTGEVDPVALIASRYPRAIETAEILSPALGGLPVAVEPGVGEHDPGPECDGLSFEAFIERHGRPNWEDDPYGVTFPGGETLAEFQHRVGEAIHRIVADHPDATVVVVCHGGVIDTAFRQLLRLPPTGAFELRTTNTSITELVRLRPGRWQLVRYNDAGHLEGLPADSA
jgi:probable phosphoglycerate mutase